MDRRQFLIATAAAATLPLPAFAAPARPRGSGPGAIWVDAQGGIDGYDEKDGRLIPSAGLVEAVKSGWINVVSQTVGEVGTGPDRFRSAVEGLAFIDRFVAEMPSLFVKALSAADLRSAKAAGKVAIVCNFQDTTPLEGDPSRVATFKALGLRVLQLTYNKRNLAGDGCLERANAGLSDFGRQVIAEIERNKLLLDLSHSGQRTTAEGIAEAKRPPAITHTGCRDLVDLPRNQYDRELRALADKGGVAGIYLMPFLKAKGQPGREDLIRHIEHAVNVAGEDHVGIGTDNPLTGYTIDDAARKAQREFFEDRSKRGIAAPGEAADVFNMVEGYNDAPRYSNLAADLAGRGWKAARIDKVLGGNFVRLFGEAWGG
ncbi:MAG: rane dipeptidase [Sphingomonadales bacterium]|jgi:membrane dipeptidase|nr:rane dipeptidase [Sphingomonadales bacterium]